jgi:hypothetical protein
MPLNTIPLPYGLRDLKVTPYTDAAATTLAGASIDLPNSQTFSFTEAEDFEDLRGDDQLQTSHGKGAQVNWELGYGGISFEAYAAIAGGKIVTTGTTPNQIKTYSKYITDDAGGGTLFSGSRPFFKIEGQSISDSGGDFHSVVYRCRSTGDVNGTQEDGKFWITGAKGIGYASKAAASLGKLYDFVQNETAASIA